MILKEFILINVLLISLLLYLFTFQKMVKHNLCKQTKLFYTYLTFILPLLGFLLCQGRTNGRYILIVLTNKVAFNKSYLSLA
jgi:hypothetical protein